MSLQISLNKNQNFHLIPEDDTCTICMSKFATNEKILVLACSHFFHKTCIEPWGHQKNCPLCRRKISSLKTPWKWILTPNLGWCKLILLEIISLGTAYLTNPHIDDNGLMLKKYCDSEPSMIDLGQSTNRYFLALVLAPILGITAKIIYNYLITLPETLFIQPEDSWEKIVELVQKSD